MRKQLSSTLALIVLFLALFTGSTAQAAPAHSASSIIIHAYPAFMTTHWTAKESPNANCALAQYFIVETGPRVFNTSWSIQTYLAAFLDPNNNYCGTLYAYTNYNIHSGTFGLCVAVINWQTGGDDGQQCRGLNGGDNSFLTSVQGLAEGGNGRQYSGDGTICCGPSGDSSTPKYTA